MLQFDTAPFRTSILFLVEWEGISFPQSASTCRLRKTARWIDIGPPATERHLLDMAAMLLSPMSASLIGRLGSSAFRLSTTTVSMSLAGSCFSSESAPRPFHHGIRRRGGTIFGAALPSYRQ